MKKLTEIEIINIFAISLLSQNSLDDLLWDMSRNIGQLMGFEDCVIYLREGETLIQKATYGIKNPELRKIKNPIVHKIGKGIAGSIAMTKQPELIPDIRLDERYVQDEFNGRSELAVPLLFEGEVLGVIDCESSQINGFSTNDFATIKLIANIATPRLVSALSHLQKEKTEIDLIHARNEAEKANQAKTKFLSNMSHELRTPLNAILGFSQLLEINPKEPLTTKQQNSVKHILHSGRYLLELINQVFDLTKIESGKLSLSLEKIELNDICKECLSIIKSSTFELDLLIKSDLADIHTVIADYTRTKQVILNLLTNAVKYNNRNGSIALKTKNISGNKVQVSITDTGIGIPKDKQDELFEPFNRLGNENSNIKGTGVGLALSKELVKAMGGEIGYQNHSDKGSTFWIELPVLKL